VWRWDTKPPVNAKTKREETEKEEENESESSGPEEEEEEVCGICRQGTQFLHFNLFQAINLYRQLCQNTR